MMYFVPEHCYNLNKQCILSLNSKFSGGSRGASGGYSNPPPPPPVFFKYPIKVKEFGLSKTKLFHFETNLFNFHGIFKKLDIKSAKRTPILLYIRTPFPEILDPPLKLTFYEGLQSLLRS